MNALPPPQAVQYAQMGLNVGVVYGLASVYSMGASAALFPLVGYLLGKIAGALQQ